MRTDNAERTDWPAPDLLGRRLLRRAAARWWWAPLLGGVVWFLIAWLVLRADATSLATVGVLVGAVFLLAAVNEAALAWFAAGGWRAAHYILGAVFVLGAAWAFARPIDTFFALASVLGLILLLQGALYITRGIALRGLSPYWGLELLNGVLLTLLGLWVSASDRVFDLAGRTAFILLWVGLWPSSAASPTSSWPSACYRPRRAATVRGSTGRRVPRRRSSPTTTAGQRSTGPGRVRKPRPRPGDRPASTGWAGVRPAAEPGGLLPRCGAEPAALDPPLARQTGTGARAGTWSGGHCQLVRPCITPSRSGAHRELARSSMAHAGAFSPRTSATNRVTWFLRAAIASAPMSNVPRSRAWKSSGSQKLTSASVPPGVRK